MRVPGGLAWIPDIPSGKRKAVSKDDLLSELSQRSLALDVIQAMARRETILCGGSQSSHQNGIQFPAEMYEHNYIRTKLDQGHGM